MNVFEHQRFEAPPERCAYLLQALSRRVPLDCEGRLVDIGCGTGEQLIEIARHFPRLQLVGVDISDENVRAAREKSAAAGMAERIKLHCADYLRWEQGPFRIMLADSTVQNIAGDTAELVRKLSGDLGSGGLLFMTVPYDCRYNRSLWRLRKWAAPLRGGRIEHGGLAVLRLLYRGRYSAEFLRQRSLYMYLVPMRCYDSRFRQALAAANLLPLHDEAAPHLSFLQPKHRLYVIEKRAAAN